MEQFNEKLLEVMLGNGLVSELAYRFPLLLSWLTWVAASIVCLLVAIVACLKWFLLSEWEIKETFSTMVFQGYLYYLITPTSGFERLCYNSLGFFLGSLPVRDPKQEYVWFIKDWELKKETTFAFGKFTTISGHFLPTT